MASVGVAAVPTADRGRGLGFNPVAEAAQRPVGFQRRGDGGDQVIEGACPAGAHLDDDLQFGAVLIVVAQRRQRHFWFARLAVAQDNQPGRRDPLGQDLVTQGEGGKRLKPRMQRGEDGFAGGGHSSPGEKRRWAALTCGLLLEKFVEEPASAYTINFDIQVCRTSLSDQGFIRCLMVLLSYETNV